MAKTPRLKVQNPSKHSRAARREAAPPTKTLEEHVEAADKIPHVKQTQNYAGVSKKRAQSKQLSRQQRKRLAKGMERAETIIDQLEVKRSQSSGRAKRTKDRSHAWEDVNGKITKSVPAQGAFAVLGDGNDASDDDWEDEDETKATEADEKAEGDAIDAVKTLQVSGDAPKGLADEEEDEVL